MITEDTYRQRATSNGHGFVLTSSGARGLAEEASEVFNAFGRAVGLWGGFLLEDMIEGTDPKGFATLMHQREAGDRNWEHAVPEGKRAHARTLKLPTNMMVLQGFPCWALNGRTYSLDLYNPADELGFSSGIEGRAWQIAVWPPGPLGFDSLPPPPAWPPGRERVRRASDAASGIGRLGDLIALVGVLAETLDASFGMGGTGLAHIPMRARSNPGSVGQLSDWVLPFMLLPNEVELPGVRLLALDEARDLTGHEGWCRVLGQLPRHRLVWAALREPSGYPDGSVSGIRALAKALGRSTLSVFED